jgi:hypothetical protein
MMTRTRSPLTIMVALLILSIASLFPERAFGLYNVQVPDAKQSQEKIMNRPPGSEIACTAYLINKLIPAVVMLTWAWPKFSSLR